MRRGANIERVIFFGFLLGLAVCPFWLGSNRLGAWGINAVFFSALLIAYECSLLVSGKPHPFPIGWIKVPAICFALVVALDHHPDDTLRARVMDCIRFGRLLRKRSVGIFPEA